MDSIIFVQIISVLLELCSVTTPIVEFAKQVRSLSSCHHAMPLYIDIKICIFCYETLSKDNCLDKPASVHNLINCSSSSLVGSGLGIFSTSAYATIDSDGSIAAKQICDCSVNTELIYCNNSAKIASMVASSAQKRMDR